MSVEGRPPEGGEQAALARLVRELAIPVPFDLDTFGCWLQRHSGHRVRLAPVTLPSGTPFGVLLRRAGADYLYYEEQTFPFHQAHIVLCLAAPLLLGETFRPSIDLRLVPDVCPQLVRMMLGEPTECTRRWCWAEAFAFLVLDQARPAVLERHDLRQLRTLHDALRSAVPDADDSALPQVGPASRFGLHRQVIEIYDVMLMLRPYRDPRAASAAAAAGRAAGLAGDELAASVEAAVLAVALQAKIAGQEARHAAGGGGGGDSWPPAVGAGLAEEAAWLARVSRAFAQKSV